jgi:hypothetical protein
MIPFWLFIITGVSTGVLTFSSIMMGIWGAPTHWIQFVSLLGSLLIVFAAYVCAFSLRVGRWFASVALAAVATYYIPAIPSLLPRQHMMIQWWVYLIQTLFLVSSAYTIACFCRRVHQPLFPAHASRTGIVVICGFTVLSIASLTWYFTGLGQQRIETFNARWEPTTSEQNSFGKQMIRFVALDGSVSVLVASDELFKHLKEAHKQTVELQIGKTYDHGRFRVWSVRSIDGQQGNFNWIEGKIRE